MNPFTIYTFEEHNLGDNLVFLHLLRSLAKEDRRFTFVHFCNGCHIVQLREVVHDLPNIVLFPFESQAWQEHGSRAINVWKNFQDMWVESPLRWKWADFTIWHHKVTARRMGFESTLTRREALLFDYPALESTPTDDGEYPFDFLIGDSAPNSGQYSEWADHLKNPMQPLIDALRRKWRVRLTSELKAEGFTITEIGRLSVHCKHHIMVPNGPFWTCMSTANNHHSHGRRRIVILDNGEDLGMPHIDQVPNVAALTEIAKQEGWIE